MKNILNPFHQDILVTNVRMESITKQNATSKDTLNQHMKWENISVNPVSLNVKYKWIMDPQERDTWGEEIWMRVMQLQIRDKG